MKYPREVDNLPYDVDLNFARVYQAPSDEGAVERSETEGEKLNNRPPAHELRQGAFFIHNPMDKTIL